jgi:thioredoxin 1
MEPNSLFPRLERIDVSDGGGDVIVHFWAPWNGYDDAFAERLADSARACGALGHCRSHNTDDPSWSEDLARWGVVNVPALAFFRNGKHVETVIGLRPVEELRGVLSRWCGVAR